MVKIYMLKLYILLTKSMDKMLRKVTFYPCKSIFYMDAYKKII